MALTNTLYAALSGLDVNQAKLNVVGNNIANVNTVAFKSTRAVFKPQFYLTDSGGSQPDTNTGGANPSQRGLGATVAGMERNLNQGPIETTGRDTDLAISGNGYFVVRSDEVKYTRDGTFNLNHDNKLVTSGGDFVQGYGVDARYNVVTGALTDITIPEGSIATATATTQASIEGNLKASGTVATSGSVLNSQAITTAGGTLPADTTLLTDLVSTTDATTPLFNVGDQFNFSAQKGSRDLPAAPFEVTSTTTLGDLMTFFQQRLGINPDATSGSTTSGVAFQADASDPAGASGSIVITGNSGTENSLAIPPGGFTTSFNISPLSFTPTATANGESVQTSFIAYDSLGTPISVSVTSVLESTATTGSTWRFYVESSGSTDGSLVVGTGTLAFDSLGRLRESTGTDVSIDRGGTGAVTPLNFSLDFSNMTSLTSRTSEMAMTNQDGTAMGRLVGFSIDDTGRILGNFSNGEKHTLGQVAMATFSNPQGLLDRGGNMFVQGPDSGPAVVGTPGSMGAGKLVSQALELSNVDLSEEFINMIVASTGFSASSRVISTSDQLLTELLNSSR